MKKIKVLTKYKVFIILTSLFCLDDGQLYHPHFIWLFLKFDPQNIKLNVNIEMKTYSSCKKCIQVIVCMKCIFYVFQNKLIDKRWQQIMHVIHQWNWTHLITLSFILRFLCYCLSFPLPHSVRHEGRTDTFGRTTERDPAWRPTWIN